MKDNKKTKKQLIDELVKLRKRIAVKNQSDFEYEQEEYKLQESKRKFQTCVENLLDGFGLFSAVRDQSGKIIDFRYDFINDAGCKLNQRTREEQIGKTLLELLPEHQESGLMEEYTRVVETGKPLIKYSYLYEDVYGGAKRLSRIFDFQAVKLGDGFAVTWRDITESQQAEEALKTSLKTAADLVYSTPYGLFIYQYEKPDRLILLSGNPKAERLTGIKIDDWIGKENNEIWPEARKAGVTDAYLKVMKTGKTYETENLYYKDEKLEGVFRIRAFRLPKEKLCVSFENITEQKKIEENLKLSEEKYRSLIESTDDLIYLVDKNYSYIFMNKKHAERFNLPFKKIIGKPYSEFHSKKESEVFRKDINKVIRTGNPITHEHKSARDNKFFLRTFSPVKNEEGKVMAVNVISKDISELKHVENELKQSEQEIHKFAEYLQTVREKERALVAGELHDEVGQALTGLKMDIFMIKNKMSKDQKEIPSEFQRMEKLLDNSIKKLKKIYSELRPSLLEHFGIGEAMRQHCIDFQEQSGTKCTFYQDPEEIILDENRSIALYRIFQGAINNIKWHSQATKVDIRLEEKGPNLKLTIRDNGKGIKEKNQEIC